jgi:Ca2+-binding RTX toxin-like protein
MAFVSNVARYTSVLTTSGDTIIGTPGADALTGYEGVDSIVGFAGRDMLRGVGGGDKLDGGEDNDYLYSVRVTTPLSIVPTVMSPFVIAYQVE